MTNPDDNDARDRRPVVLFGGRASALVDSALIALALEDARGGLASLELRLRNHHSTTDGEAGPSFDDDGLLHLGQSVAVGMGDQAEQGSMFSGFVTAIEEVFDDRGAPQLCVLAEDALQKARLARRTKVHDALSLPSFCAELARSLGLQARVTGFDQPLGTQVQCNESDLAFLRRLLAARDGAVHVIERELHVRPLNQVRRGEVELTAGSQLLRMRLSADLAHQVSQITVSGWDAGAGRRIRVTSAPSDLGPGSGLTGAAWLTRSDIERNEHVAHVPVRDEQEARALADSVHAQRARGLVRLHATARGDWHIRVGTHVRLRGVSPRFENTYVVNRTSHHYERGGDGYRTEFEAECGYLKEGR